jgi:hypothetical protein
MREIPPHNIVATRHDHVGRFALFHSPAPSIFPTIPWRAVNLEVGTEDSVTVQVHLDEHDDPGAAAWTARDLVRIAFARQLAEFARSDDALASLSAFHLMLAFGQLQRRPDLPPVPEISTRSGSHSSAYPWNVAAIDGVGTIQLCPDPLGDGEGITPELLLHVIDLLLGDAARGIRADGHLHAAAHHAGAALRTETARMRLLRGPTMSL